MLIGRITAQLGKSRVAVQLRIPAPLRRHAAEGRHAGLPQPRLRLDRSRQQRRARSCRPKRRPRPRAATSTCRSTSTRARGRWPVEQQAAVRGRLRRRSAISRSSGIPPPDGITNLIPVTEQSNAINPATGLPLRAAWRTTAIAAWNQWGPGESARPTTSPGRCRTSPARTARRSASSAPARPAGRQTLAGQTQLGYRFNQGVPNAVSYYLPEMGRRTITYNTGAFVQDTWTRKPADAAGRPALRSRDELRARRRQRHDSARRRS